MARGADNPRGDRRQSGKHHRRRANAAAQIASATAQAIGAPQAALARYVAHWQVSAVQDHLGLGLDAATFTGRESGSPLTPSELDITPEIIGRADLVEFHIAYERDLPLTHFGTLRQSSVYAMVSLGFDLIRPAPPAAVDARAP